MLFFPRRTQILLFACAASLAALAPLAAQAADASPSALVSRARSFLLAQSAGRPGALSVQVKPPSSSFPACDSIDAFLPSGSRPIGRTLVGVRCESPVRWTAYLSAQVRLLGSYAVSARPLSPSASLSSSDISVVKGDLGELPPDVISDPSSILGFRPAFALAAGAPLRASILKAPLAVAIGETVRIVAQGEGFSASSEGVALSASPLGGSVRVRARSGLVVSGIASAPGEIQVSF